MKTRPYYFAVLDEHTRGKNVRGFLDMLRYDQARIHRIEGSYMLLETEQIPTTARWTSFHIPVWFVSTDSYEVEDRIRNYVRERNPLPKSKGIIMTDDWCDGL